MAEIAGLSLASNILQMVDYGRQFATTAWKIYQSGEDALDGFSSLQMLSKNLEDVSRRLQKEDVEKSESPSAEDQISSAQGMADLCQESIKTAKEMLEVLEKIGLSRKGKPRKREALRSAFMSLWNEDKIRALQQRLDSLGPQVVLFLVEKLRFDGATSTERQESGIQQLLQGNEELKSRIEEMSWRGDDTSLARVSIQWIMQRMRSDATTGSSLELLEESALKRLTPNTEDLSVDRRQFLEKRFLRQLQYDDMDNRQETVEDAHKETFRWIFDDPDRLENGYWANFREWLDSPKQLYWITGKPGAGKSTLMKFIWDAVASKDSDGPCFDLEPKDRHMTVANFYFWAAGSSIQRSREGLYRTLLHQLLKQHAHAIPGSSPDRWEALCLFGAVEKRFTEYELQSMLRDCLEQLRHTKVCLFIDGLDEFSGDYDDLVKFFSKLIKDHPVKLCLSSRPLMVFEEAFQHKPTLRIHELTSPDIKAYVRSQLRKSPSFIALQSHDRPYTSNLVNQILQKAQGVFLWVKLVVASLVEGLRDGDTRIETQRRLDGLPDDLEDLFHRILKDLKPEHQRRAALYLGFMGLCPGPPLALLFSFAEEHDPEFALKLPLSPLSSSVIDERTIIMRKRVNTGCRGLLEVTPDRNLGEDNGYRLPRIQYCHRSVKDYVETTRAQTLLATHKELHHHIRLCSGNLALRKSLSERILSPRLSECLPEVLFHCLGVAAFVPKSDTKMLIRILDELERSCIGCLDTSKFRKLDCFNWRYTLEGRPRDPDTQFISRSLQACTASMNHWADNSGWPGFILLIAVKCNALEWVRHRLGGKYVLRLSSWAIRASTQVLDKIKARKYMPSYGYHFINLDLFLLGAVLCETPNPDMVEFLLRSGASSALIIDDYLEKRRIWHERSVFYTGGFLGNTSIWESTLMMVIHAFSVNSKMSPQDRPNWRRVAQLMVAHGAFVSRSAINNAIVGLHSMSCDIASVREDMDVVGVLKTGLEVLTTSEAKKRGQREIPGWRMTRRRGRRDD